MRKSQFAAICARRLRVAPGRINALSHRAAEASLLPMADGSRYPDLTPDDAARFLISVLADRGLGHVPATVREFAALRADSETLERALAQIMGGGEALHGAVAGCLVLHLDPASASLTASGLHRRFGPEPPGDTATKTIVVPGATLAAIGLEFGGKRPDEADSLVALARVSRSISLAFESEIA